MTLLDSTFPADWLMAQEFPPVQYVVDGVIPEGLTMIVAAPKIGKSWLVLGLSIASSAGGIALGGIHVTQRPVLYLALEDGPRRLKSRLEALDYGQPSPELHFATDVPKANILATIHEFMEAHADRTPVVVLDTLGKAMPPAVMGETQYERDYRVVGKLKELSDAYPGSAIIVVHHTRKADGGDFVDGVSGTQGLAGAADTVALLKRDRQADSAVLQVTSRDAAEGEYELEKHGIGNWQLAGGSLTDAAQAAQTSKQTAGVGDRMGELIELVGKYPEGLRRKDIAELMHFDENQLGKYLRRAVEQNRLGNPKRGIYTPVTNVISVTFPKGDPS